MAEQMAIGVGIGTIGKGYVIPEILPLRNMHPDGTTIFPAMFISVACGAMVCEGIIALVWAAASCALFPVEGGLMTGLKEAMAAGQSSCVYNICSTTMGGFGCHSGYVGGYSLPYFLR